MLMGTRNLPITRLRGGEEGVMKVSNIAGSVALYEIMARHGAALLQEKPKVHREPRTARVNTAEGKQKSGTATEKKDDSTKKVGRTRTA